MTLVMLSKIHIQRYIPPTTLFMEVSWLCKGYSDPLLYIHIFRFQLFKSYIGSQCSDELLSLLGAIRETETSPAGPVGVASSEVMGFVDVIELLDFILGELDDLLVCYEREDRG
jgi:hypothetical protein